MKTKNNGHKKLQEKIKNNKSLILIYKRLTPVCMALFVLIAFFSFYSSVIKIENNSAILYKSFLVVLFGLLTIIYFTINKKEKENKKIISKLYN